MQIIDLFAELSRQHLSINSFVYGKAYEKGPGNNVYPLVWLDDPVQFGSIDNGEIAKALRYTANVDFLGLPADKTEIAAVQDAAFTVGLNFIEKIKETRAALGFGLEGFNGITLSDYYDDDAAGVRFTFTLTAGNPVDRCAEVFDPEKIFTKTSPLPNFLADNPEGCAVFNEKGGLPNFSLT